MKAYTDYPISELGDEDGKIAPIREVKVLSYDGDKYCRVLVRGMTETIKSGYLYLTPGRCGKVKCIGESPEFRNLPITGDEE